jgi:Mg2+ and Co2+ transporter CorA
MEKSNPAYDPLIWLLDGSGGARRLDRGELSQWDPGRGPVWIELDEASDRDRAWLEAESGLEAEGIEASLRQHAWPTIRSVGRERVFVLMRVLGSDPRSPDWVSSLLRMWVEPKRVISMTPRGLPHIEALKHRLRAGRGPTSVGTVLLFVNEVMADRLADAVLELIPSVLDELTLDIRNKPPTPRIEQVHSLRRRIVVLQRYANPQRALLTRLRSLDLAWLTKDHGQDWRVLAAYYLEASRELDAMGEHARVHEDSLAGRIAEQTSRRVYTLTLVSTLVLPLSLVTSLLAVSIGTVDGNILGAHHPLWFVGLCIGLAILAVGIFIAFRRWWV